MTNYVLLASLHNRGLTKSLNKNLTNINMFSSNEIMSTTYSLSSYLKQKSQDRYHKYLSGNPKPFLCGRKDDSEDATDEAAPARQAVMINPKAK